MGLREASFMERNWRQVIRLGQGALYKEDINSLPFAYLNLVLQGLNIVNYLIQHECLSGNLLGRTISRSENSVVPWNGRKERWSFIIHTFSQPGTRLCSTFILSLIFSLLTWKPHATDEEIMTIARGRKDAFWSCVRTLSARLWLSVASPLLALTWIHPAGISSRGFGVFMSSSALRFLSFDSLSPPWGRLCLLMLPSFVRQIQRKPSSGHNLWEQKPINGWFDDGTTLGRPAMKLVWSLAIFLFFSPETCCFGAFSSLGSATIGVWLIWSTTEGGGKTAMSIESLLSKFLASAPGSCGLSSDE